MTAISQSTLSIPLASPPKPSVGERKRKIKADAATILELAHAAGWGERKPAYVTRRRNSHYLKLTHPDRGRVTIRISDHVPVAPIAGGYLLHVVGVPGSLGSAIAWLCEGGAV